MLTGTADTAEESKAVAVTKDKSEGSMVGVGN